MLYWTALLSTLAVAHPQPAGPATTDSAAMAAIYLDDGPEHQFCIQIDYRFDVEGFFDDPATRANLEAAVEIWSERIYDDFPTVPAGTPMLVINPHTMEEQRVVLEYDVDDLVIFVASNRDIDTMAKAAPSTRWFRKLDRQFPEDARERIHGDDFQPWAGFLAVNPDGPIPLVVDETPDTDDDIPLNTHKRYDFMTLALHELGHIFGIGTAPVFNDLSGLLPSDGLSTKSTSDGRLMVVWSAYSVFYGAHARKVNSTHPVRLSEDGGHLATRFIVSGQQDLMDQDLNTSRQLPTRLDLSLLSDIGYEVDLTP